MKLVLILLALSFAGCAGGKLDEGFRTRFESVELQGNVSNDRASSTYGGSAGLKFVLRDPRARQRVTSDAK